MLTDEPTDEERARAYLHVNCSMCHQPAGPASSIDLRRETPLADTGLCDPPVHGDLGVDGARRVSPGDPAESVLAIRLAASDVNRMPPVGALRRDADGIGIIDQWISGMASCP